MDSTNISKEKTYYSEIIKNLEKAETIEALHKIGFENKFGDNSFDNEKYPELCFKISKKEIQQLVGEKALSKDGTINPKFFNEKQGLSPLEKLFYAYIWKRGELNRMPSLVSGIIDKKHQKKNSGKVMNQFGRHLSKDLKEEPIIDQHVIRAFISFVENKDIKQVNSLNISDKTINNYKSWLKKIVDRETIDDKEQALRIIDHIMFGIGKSYKELFKRNS